MEQNARWKFYFVVLLTFGRVPLIFGFLAINVIAHKPLTGEWFAVAFIALAMAAAADLFDGYFARRLDVVTRFGSYADPLVDKIFYAAAFLTLVYLAALAGQRFHAGLLLAVAVLFIVRDQWVSFLRSIGAIRGVDARANWSGKLRTVVSFPVICVIYYYLQAPGDWPVRISPPVVYSLEIAGLAVNLISMWVYTVYYWPALKKELARR